MTDIVPKFHEFMWPVILAFKEIGGSASIEELEEKVFEIMKLSENVRNELHGDSGSTKVSYNMAWARSYLKLAGVLENSKRGVWALTEKGRSIDEDETKNILKNIRNNKNKTKNTPNEAEINNKQIQKAQIETSWKEELLSEIKKMKPDAFERLCQRILRESGFSKVVVSSRSGDGGIDGSGVLRINLVSFQVTFQCKRWKDAVSSPTVRDFRGAMIGRADKGLIMTTGRFTSDAQKEAIRDGAPTIDLIDGEALCELMFNLKLGVKIQMIEEVTIDVDQIARF